MSGPADAPTYLALGDSYTIGIGASSEAHNFPSLLRERMASSGTRSRLVNLGVNGYTTVDLIDTELPALAAEHPRWITVLVGVNDLVQGFSDDVYRTNLKRIYEQLADLKLPHGRVLAVSIPDFALSPSGRNFGDPAELSRKLDRFNAIARQEADLRNLPTLDITPLSREGVGRAGWFANDGLHPGDAQYRAWADLIWASVGPTWIQAPGVSLRP